MCLVQRMKGSTYQLEISIDHTCIILSWLMLINFNLFCILYTASLINRSAMETKTLNQIRSQDVGNWLDTHGFRSGPGPLWPLDCCFKLTVFDPTDLTLPHGLSSQKYELTIIYPKKKLETLSIPPNIFQHPPTKGMVFSIQT